MKRYIVQLAMNQFLVDRDAPTPNCTVYSDKARRFGSKEQAEYELSQCRRSKPYRTARILVVEDKQ